MNIVRLALTRYIPLCNRSQRRGNSVKMALSTSNRCFHVSSVILIIFFFYFYYYLRLLFFRNLNWVPWNTVAAVVAQCWTATRSLTAITSMLVISVFGSILFSKHPGMFFATIILKNYRYHIIEWMPTKGLILAIRTMRLFVRRRIIFR